MTCSVCGKELHKSARRTLKFVGAKNDWKLKLIGTYCSDECFADRFKAPR